MNDKRYFGIILPKQQALQATLLAGYERDGKAITTSKLVGFALDYYSDETASYKKEFGDAIIGNFATRAEAEAAIENFIRRAGKIS